MIDRIVILLLAGSALFGSAIFVQLWSDDTGASTSVPVATRPERGAPPRAQGPRVDDLVTTVLSRPLFSPTRQPAARENPDQPTGLGLTDVRLTGIVIEPGRHLAIFAMPGAKAVVRVEGETVNNWRVDSITLGEVVLSGPAGSTALQPKIDASLVRRAPAPPRSAQGPPQGVAPGAPPATAPAGATPLTRQKGPGIAAPAPPGTAPLKPASNPRVTPPGTPMTPRMPDPASERR